MREKSQVEDIDRSIYDIRDEEKDAYRMKEGLTPQNRSFMVWALPLSLAAT